MPPPRPRNAVATRASILSAARQRFVRESYDNVGLREIAADAGVDAALVSRYFGSKEELFSEVLSSTGGPGDLFAGEVSDFGRRVAEMITSDPRHQEKLDGLLIMLNSASSPKAATVVRARADEEFYGPFTAWLGGENARTRARLAGAVMMGASLGRVLNADFGLAEHELADFKTRLANLLQAAITC